MLQLFSGRGDDNTHEVVDIHFEGIKEIPIFRGAWEFVEFLGPRNMLGKFVMGETPDGGITIVGRDVPCRLRCRTEIRGRFNPPHL
jgi:hypothetical protein